MTRLQAAHRRQSAIPDCFAAATLAASTRPARTPAGRAQHTRDARKVARLISRGELKLALSGSSDIETAFTEAAK